MNYFRAPFAWRKEMYDLIKQGIHCDDFHRQVLFLSHDQEEEYFHIQQQIKDEKERAAQARLWRSLMICLPGKKLFFMGTERPAKQPWKEYVEQTEKGWMDDHPVDPGFSAMTGKLNELYRTQKPLYESDSNGHDLEWIDDPQKQVHAYRRKSSDGKSLVCVHNLNHCPNAIELPKGRLLFNSNAVEFGGSGEVLSQEGDQVHVPPLTTLIFEE